MNRMEFERIKHSAAQEVFDGTEYDWVDMLDNTAEADREAMKLSEDEMKDYWLDFFKDSLSAMRWSDTH